MKTSPLAGKPAPPGMLVDVPRLIIAYRIVMASRSRWNSRKSCGNDEWLRVELGKKKNGGGKCPKQLIAR